MGLSRAGGQEGEGLLRRTSIRHVDAAVAGSAYRNGTESEGDCSCD
jgi:hypothetical protein